MGFNNIKSALDKLGLVVESRHKIQHNISRHHIKTYTSINREGINSLVYHSNKSEANQLSEWVKLMLNINKEIQQEILKKQIEFQEMLNKVEAIQQAEHLYEMDKIKMEYKIRLKQQAYISCVFCKSNYNDWDNL